MTNGKTEKQLLESRGKHNSRNLSEEQLGVPPNNQGSFGTSLDCSSNSNSIDFFIPFFGLSQVIGYLKVMPAL